MSWQLRSCTNWLYNQPFIYIYICSIIILGDNHVNSHKIIMSIEGFLKILKDLFKIILCSGR